jgi:hypothetical protein
MSDSLRIALVAEGATDTVIINAALRAILGSRSFILTQLQPEATRPEMGGGWCGVTKWCHETRLRCDTMQGTDHTLNDFDLLIIHLDIDVACTSYADCSLTAEAMAREFGWATLPCDAQPCPPVSATCDQIEVVLKSWLGQLSPIQRTLYCLPAQSSGAWLAAAVLNSEHALLKRPECDPVEDRLGQLPKSERIRKKVIEYRKHASGITLKWDQVKRICTQAESFEHNVLASIRQSDMN